MEENIKKNKRKINLLLLYQALSCDWLFIYAIDSIFLNEIKGLSFSAISLTITILSLSYILIQLPLVKLVRKIGTTTASRIGTACYLLSAVLFIFNTWTIFLSFVVFAIGMAFKTPSDSKILKDNLKMYGMSNSYAKYCGRIKFLYQILSASSCLAAGYLYQVWAYAPIVCCCVIMVVAMILSIFVRNEKELYKKQNNLPAHQVQMEKFEYFKLFKYHTTWLLIGFSALFSALVSCNMDINKMTFQEIGISAITITIINAIIRALRAFSTLGFEGIYKKFGFNTTYFVLTMLAFGIIMVGLGGTFLSGIAAIIVMSIGSVFIYAARDPFNIIREDFVMNSKGLTKRQTLLSLTNMGRYFGRLIFSLAVSGLLLSQTAAVTGMILCACMVPPLIVLSILLDRKRKINKY